MDTARRLPRRRRHGAGVRMAATQRPRVELLGQQLPARTEPTPVRHPLLECRHDQAPRRSALGLPRPVHHQRLGRRDDDGARNASRPAGGRHRYLRRRRVDRPHRPLASGVPHDATHGRRHRLRAELQRPHPSHGQPARQPEVVLPHRERNTTGRRGRVAGDDRRAPRHLVGPLGDVAAEALQRRAACANNVRQRVATRHWNPRPAATSTWRDRLIRRAAPHLRPGRRPPAARRCEARADHCCW